MDGCPKIYFKKIVSDSACFWFALTVRPIMRLVLLKNYAYEKREKEYTTNKNNTLYRLGFNQLLIN